MASPPRSRVNQYFSSKKRKPSSPASMSGTNEKDVKTMVEGSPGAKGTLDNYLLGSQDNSISPKPSLRVCDSLAQQDQVRRNLTSMMDNSLKDEFKQLPLSSQLHSRANNASKENQKETSKGLTKVGDGAVGDTVKDYLALTEGGESAELKEFAADFLSLYCSDVRPNESTLPEMKVNDHKRQASPSQLDREDTIFKKRHLITNQSYMEHESSCCSEKSSEAMQSGRPDENRVTVVNELLELQSTLKTCSNTPKQFVDMFKCYTPGSLTRKSIVRETPKSCGSSSFSPGEAFWNYAIQLADGLCAQAAEVISAADIQYHSKSSCNLRNAPCDGKSKEMLNEGERMDNGANSGPEGKYRKDLDKEVSPLPVKHLDFSCEDKNLGEVVPLPHHCDAYNLKSAALIGGEQSESSLTDHRGLRNTIMTCCSKSQENQVIFREPEPDTVNAVTNMKVDLTGKDNDSMTSYSPVDEVVKLNGNHESSEASTPSSSMPLKDCLNLNSWLPPEICSIYRKKGISKLYPWQVSFKF